MKSNDLYMKIIQDIIKSITLNDEKYEKLYKYVEKIKNDISNKLSLFLEDPNKDVFLGGSFPRRTFLKYDFDADIIVRFPTGFSREELEEIIFKTSYEMFGRERVRKRFAEHPYAEVFLDKVVINIVPAYKISPPNWLSPVDRTYYHSKYLEKYLPDELINETVVLKSFLKGVDCYGAEIRIKGFSGYLCELLILYYRSFLNLIRNVQRWRPPVIIDIEHHYRSKKEILDMFPKFHLIVVDPVDKGRNVASALSKRNFSRFVSAAKTFLHKPRKTFFYPYSKNFLKNYLSVFQPKKIKDLPILVIKISHGEKIEDIYYGQLERLARKIRTQIELSNVKVLKTGIYSDFKEKSLILMFLSSKTPPKYYLKMGPPTFYASEDDFLSKNLGERISWIEDDYRWHVIKGYKINDIKSLVSNIITEKMIKIPSEIRNDMIEISYIDELEDTYMRSIREWVSSFILGEDYWKAFY